MDRRELLKWIAAVTGTAVVGGEFFLSGCTGRDDAGIGIFTAKDISFFDEVSETILPRTDTPGAKDAEVGKFMTFYATGCYSDAQLKAFKNSVETIDDASEKKYNRGFLQLDASQRQQLLTAIDADAKRHDKENENAKLPHYFTMVKQLVLLGFFTSKPGATQVLRYNPVPGKYEGCIDYKGETSWA